MKKILVGRCCYDMSYKINHSYHIHQDLQNISKNFKNIIMLYVVEILNLTTFISLMEVATFEQAISVINKKKSFSNYKGEVYYIICSRNIKSLTHH